MIQLWGNNKNNRMNSIPSHTLSQDSKIWNVCAIKYEEHIVSGHPNITAYESFEEDLLDQIIRQLSSNTNKNIIIYDVGCGSGRLHIRYGSKMLDTSNSGLCKNDVFRIECSRKIKDFLNHDPLLTAKIQSVGGIDISAQMLEIAKSKLVEFGLKDLLGEKLWFEKGSAFDIKPMSSDCLPIVVCLCNSIGVMQGHKGAELLFQAMRRAVERASGIAIISAYDKKAIRKYALNNYESTMEVSGQPIWLKPNTYASKQFKQIPHSYKLSDDNTPFISVDVYTQDEKLVKTNHKLYRNEELVNQTIASGVIRTYHNYVSHWYSYNQFEQWIDEHWIKSKSLHLRGSELDNNRAEPSQIAILDFSGKVDTNDIIIKQE